MKSDLPHAGYAFFCNKDCEFFPCHKGIAPERFNCLFCYCPLYALGSRCGGNFTYTDTGIKDCSQCTLPHQPEAYSYIIEKFPLLADLARQNKDSSPTAEFPTQ